MRLVREQPQRSLIYQLLAYHDQRYEMPSIESRTISNAIKKSLNDIKIGQADDRYGWVHKVNSAVLS